MTEPDAGFSNKTGGMHPPGFYTYPPGTGGSTPENPLVTYIPYPYVPGRTEVCNPADIPNNSADLKDDTD